MRGDDLRVSNFNFEEFLTTITQKSEAHLLRHRRIRWAKAESEGFEPSIPFRVYTLSKRAPSATRTTLHFVKGCKFRLCQTALMHFP
jgi:hypothetical protein